MDWKRKNGGISYSKARDGWKGEAIIEVEPSTGKIKMVTATGQSKKEVYEKLINQLVSLTRKEV